MHDSELPGARSASFASSPRKRASVFTGTTLGNAIGLTPAVHSVFGLFLIPLSEEFGWSRASISGALGVLAGISIFTYPAIGRYADRHGTWRICFAGVVLFALVLAGGALLTGALWQFYLFYILLSLAAALVGPSLFLKMLAETHHKNFGFAAGFAGGVGNGVGAAAIPVLAAALMMHHGWRATYLGVGVAVLAVGLVSMILLRGVGGRPSPAERDSAGTAISLGVLAVRLDFWIIFLSLALMAGLTIAVFGHVGPILAERGFGMSAAAAVIATWALTCVMWEPIGGWLIDRFGYRMIVPPYLATVPGLFLLCTATSPGAALLGGMLMAIGSGTNFCAMAVVVERQFGVASFGGVMGFMYSGIFVGQGLGAVALDLVYDREGSYLTALAGSGLLVIASAILLLAMRRHPGERTRPLRMVPLVQNQGAI